MSPNDTKTTPWKIPQQLLSKIYDLTGDGLGKNQGFLLFFIDSEGNPMGIVSEKADKATILALAKSAELWLDSLSQPQFPFEIED